MSCLPVFMISFLLEVMMMTEVCCVSFLLEYSLWVVSLGFPLFLLFLLFSKLFLGVFREVKKLNTLKLELGGVEELVGDIAPEIGRSSQDELRVCLNMN